MSNYKRFYVIAIVLALVLVVTISMNSYAFFSANVTNNGTVNNSVVTTGEMAIEFTDGPEIGLDKALPGSYVEKTFSVKNVGTLDTTYTIYLSDLINNFKDKTDLVYALTSNDGGYNTTNEVQIPEKSSSIMEDYPIGANQTHTYTLRVTFKETNDDQNDNKGRKFSSVIRINEVIEIPKNSILGYLEDNDYGTTGEFEDTIVANNVSYPAHIYNFEGNQEWTTETVPNGGKFGAASDVGTSSTNATKMVIVKVDGDLTIGSGVSVLPYYDTSYGGPKGFLLYVSGTLTNNGTIDNSHGAKAAGQQVYLFENATYTSDADKFEIVPATGGTGGAKIAQTENQTSGKGGSAGSGRGTGGGGSGQVIFRGTVNKGGNGTSYSGGAGSGSANGCQGTYVTSSAGSSSGGAGSAGVGNGGCAKVGGVGNPTPAITKCSNYCSITVAATSGTGGLLIIYANDFINNTGSKITANGTKSGRVYDVSNNKNVYYAGGSSGGGSINIFYEDSYTAPTTISAAGGVMSPGGSGGAGTITVGSVASGTFVKNN